jgi:hypothetical protein
VSLVGNDPLNKRFGEDWQRLTHDLLFDSEGSLKFKPDLWRDIRTVIMPTLVDQIGYVPIPRVEYTDDTMDMVIENLTLSGRNLFPNLISMETHNFLKFSPYKAIGDESHHEFTLTLGQVRRVLIRAHRFVVTNVRAQIQADMRDVAFWFRKKSGFPKLQDSGLADVLLGGEGLTITAHLTSAEKDKSSVFKVKNVNVKMDTLKFSIRDSKHDLLYKTLRPLATGLVKKQIQKAIEDSMRTAFEYVDGQLVGVRDRYAEARDDPDGSRTEALKTVRSRLSLTLTFDADVVPADVPAQEGRGERQGAERQGEGRQVQRRLQARLAPPPRQGLALGLDQPRERARGRGDHRQRLALGRVHRRLSSASLCFPLACA